MWRAASFFPKVDVGLFISILSRCFVLVTIGVVGTDVSGEVRTGVVGDVKLALPVVPSQEDDEVSNRFRAGGLYALSKLLLDKPTKYRRFISDTIPEMVRLTMNYVPDTFKIFVSIIHFFFF